MGTHNLGFYTYMHRKPGVDGVLGIFYIGKGKGYRAWDTFHRSTWWKRINAKYGTEVLILAEWNTEEEALEHERLLILCFRGLGAKLANVAGDGGQSGWKMSEESKKKISEGQKRRDFNTWDWARGDRSPSKKLEVRAKQSMSAKGRAPEHYSCHRGENNHSARAVVCIETGQRFETMKDAAAWLRFLGFDKASNKSICSACCGSKKTAYGCHWQYAETAADITVVQL